MSRAAAPGAFLTFCAFILLLLCALSTPIIKPLYYLEANVASSSELGTTLTGQVKFGVWGYCSGNYGIRSLFDSSLANGSCSRTHLGYTFDPNDELGVAVLSSDNVNKIFTAVTTAFVLVPISAGLAFLTFLTSLFAVMCVSRFWEIFSFLWVLLAVIVTWISWIFNIVVFALAKRRLHSYTDGVLTARFGNALWMHLAAAIVLLTSVCFIGFGMCGSYRRARSGDYVAATNPYGAEKTTRRHFWQRRQQGTGTY